MSGERKERAKEKNEPLHETPLKSKGAEAPLLIDLPEQ
jgi:hypothetical protein